MQILAVRVGRVGDTVMMTPALQAILECFPDAELTILASPEGKSLLSDFSPAIKEIWTWNRHGVLKSYTDKRKLLARISGSNFDSIYCFDTSPRIAGLFSGTKAAFHWFHDAKVMKHSARHYLDLVASTCDRPVSDFYNYLPVDEIESKQLVAELATLGISADDAVVMMHPTYSGYSTLGLRKRQARIRKLWPPSYYAQLGKRLATSRTADGRQVKPIIALLAKELPLGEKIVKNSNGAVTLLVSHASFGRYKALLKRADVLLTPDSGPMHIASALGTRIVAFFSMKDPNDCGPYMPAAFFKILRSDDPTRGISTIDPETVYQSITRMLNAE